MLAYKVPPEPSRGRIGLWRKLKGMGAVYLQSGVCLLPKTDEHLRKLKILENDIAEMRGEALLLETVGLDQRQHDKVIARFNDDRNEAYQEFIGRCSDFEAEIAKETAAKHFTYAELEENDEDLKKLRGWLDKIGKLDFYGAPLASEAAAHLERCEAVLDTYAREVFAAQEENLPGGSAESE
jgi:hypothetical protein